MNEHDQKQQIEAMRKLLKAAMSPVSATEPPRDLWPDMLRRLETRAIRVPWWDWALLAAATAVFLFFPGTIPALLYHL